MIGIDVGCKLDNWFTCSNEYVQKRRSQEKIDKQILGYQKKFDRQLNALKIRKGTDEVTPQDYSESMKKTLKKINKGYKKITNRKKNDVREFANYLLDQNPKAVVFEDFRVEDWYNHDADKPKFVRDKINKAIHDSMLCEAKIMITNTLKSNNVDVILADKKFPSTQICSNCGYRQKLTLNQKLYKCPQCGLVMNRDLNASINLQHYGEDLINDKDLNIDECI